MPGGRDRACRVEPDSVALGALGAGEDLASCPRVLLGRAALELVGVAAADPELARVDRPLPDDALDDLADGVRARGGELVDSVRAVHDERPVGAECREHVRDRADELGRIDAEDARPHAGGVRQRAEEVEDRARPELTPHGSGVAHGRMVRRREHEAEAEPVDRLCDSLGRLLEAEPERLEDVGGARRRAHRTVSVLGDGSARRRRDYRRDGRDVERSRSVPARPDHVDHVVSGGVDGEDVLAHRVGTTRNLLRGLPLGAKRDEESRDLGLRCLSAHDLVHHGVCLCPVEGLSFEDLCDRVLDHRTKFPAISDPSGVRTLSGWNWTPSIGWVRCRTPMTSPSAVRAVISSSSGTRTAASE